MKIRVKKPAVHVAASSKKIDVLSEENCLYSVNFLALDGAYVPGYVFEEAENYPIVTEGLDGAFFSETTGATFLWTSSRAWLFSGGALTSLGALAGEPVFAEMYISGLACAVMLSGTDRVVHTGYAQQTAEGEYSFRAGTVHCGRFFGADSSGPFMLRWAASHPLDWSEGIYGSGYIMLPPEGGGILRLFSYDDRLIAVRERGVTVVRAYGDPQNYKVDATANYLTADGIIARTCAFCDGKLYFCTNGGLYAFDGSGIDLLAAFPPDISEPAFAAAMGVEYFLACTDKNIGECVFAYSRGAGCVCRIAPTLLFAGKDGVYALCGQKMGRLRRGGQGEWHSRPVEEGGKPFFIRDIVTVCDGQAQVTLTSAGVSRSFEGGRQAVNGGGRAFSFSVAADGTLRSLTAEAEV